MIATPEIVETARQEAAVIHLTVKRSEMPSVFGPAVGELLRGIAAQGIEPVGAIFAHHLEMTSDGFDFELGIRVTAPVEPAGRLKPGELPARRVARTIYTGPYEGLPGAWEKFNTWMKAEGHAQAEDLWELYSVGPQSTSDSGQWKTELNRPLVK